jgi:hypothetical protein
MDENETREQAATPSETPQEAQRSLGSVLLSDLNQIAVNGAVPAAAYLLGKAHGRRDPNPPAQPSKEGGGSGAQQSEN